MDLLANPSPSWPFLLVRAIAAIVFGIIALVLPGVTIHALVLLFAAYMIVDGIFGLVAGARAVRDNERWGWFAVGGVLDIAAGLIAFFWPGLTIFVFIVLAAVWAVLSGVAMIVGAVRFRREHGRGWLALGGAVAVVWGVMLFVWPIAGAVVMTLWLGAYALVFGVALLFLAFRLRQEAHRPLQQRPAA